MSRFLKSLLVLAGVVGILGTAGLPALSVYADDSTEAAKKSSCEGIGGEYKDGKCVTQSANLNTIIARVINTLSVFVGVIAVIMIMVGGFKYATAAGDSNKVTSAKNTIVYAIIGLVIVALAQVIVKFVIQTAT